MLNVMIRFLLVLPLLIVSTLAHAALKIDITQGNIDPMPIAINTFYAEDGSEDPVGNSIKAIVERNLNSSGLFRTIDSAAFLEPLNVDKIPSYVSWRQIGAIAVTSGKIKKQGGNIVIEYRLWDPSTETQLDGAALTIPERAWRRAGHKVADAIYKHLTGEDGYFDTRLLFISETGNLKNRTKKLAIMDQDGENYKELTDGRDIVLTPRFDSKLHRAIYMSYKNTVPQVFLLDIHSGYQKLVGNFPGMSFAPRFSPDGNSAIMSVAQDGTTNIIEIGLSDRRMRKLTNEFGSISTSPSYSPDGKQIVFTSDRGGRPQLYVMNRDGSDQRRISYGEGGYSTPVWSPRGDFIAFTRQQGGVFYIGVMRPDGSGERLLTSSWMDEGPTWSPNGRVIMFSRQQRGEGYQLFAVDLTGQNERKITTPTDASDPAWSPLLG
jgi:TolB protein